MSDSTAFLFSHLRFLFFCCIMRMQFLDRGLMALSFLTFFIQRPLLSGFFSIRIYERFTVFFLSHRHLT
jgi:hypothetical protein